MQTTVQAAAAYQLLDCESQDTLSNGLELTLNPKVSVAESCRLMRENSQTCELMAQADFVLVPFSTQGSFLGLERFVASVRSIEIRGSICLVCEQDKLPSRQQREWLSRVGINIVLGGVGPDCRFSDLTSNGLCGFSIADSFITEAAGDSAARSVIEAISGMARNLGVRTFARCATDPVKETAWHSGVDYVISTNTRMFQI